MNVLSLFDGMSCCYLALKKLGITPTNYYAAEIDKFAIKASTVINPNIKHMGSVTDWREWDIDWPTIDIVTGGFPCQAWSMAGKQLGDKDERGMLFWNMLDIMQEVLKANPKAKFLIENVKMKKEFEEYITFHTTKALGQVHKILINSALVSAQNRNRYYWCNWHVEQPKDKGILLKDVLQKDIEKKYFLSEKLINGFKNSTSVFKDRFKPHDPQKTNKSYCLTARYHKMGKTDPYIKVRPCESKPFDESSTCHHAANATDIKGNDSNKRIYADSGKAPTLTTMGDGHREPKVLMESKLQYRKLTPTECARLQTVPDEIIHKLIDAGISNTQLYKMLGNGWTVDVIAHIFKSMNEPMKQENTQNDFGF